MVARTAATCLLDYFKEDHDVSFAMMKRMHRIAVFLKEVTKMMAKAKGSEEPRTL
jgi:hypothetical protein